VESYLANSLPTIVAGYMARRIDLMTVANLYGGAIILLALAGLGLEFLRLRGVKPTEEGAGT
ncbi:MAG: hypothetical protein P8011_08650, partial [Acidihalobacter sp.]